MTSLPRVALFGETFHEVNGAALTARQLVEFAKRHNRPFLTVLPGAVPSQRQDGSVTHVELPRSWASFGIERDIRYDLFLWRHQRFVRRILEKFQPDVIHIFSPR